MSGYPPRPPPRKFPKGKAPPIPTFNQNEMPRKSLNMPGASPGRGSSKFLNVDTSPSGRDKSHTSFKMIPEHVARGDSDDIDWRIAKITWILNQIANAPYLMTLAMCFTIPGTFNTKPLFDSKHVTFFIWAMGLVIINSWITGYVIFSSNARSIRNIAWAQGAAFIVMNLSLMMVVHNGTFVDLDRDRIEYIQWNVFYAGPPEVVSQILLWMAMMGFLSCKRCCPTS